MCTSHFPVVSFFGLFISHVLLCSVLGADPQIRLTIMFNPSLFFGYPIGLARVMSLASVLNLAGKEKVLCMCNFTVLLQSFWIHIESKNCKLYVSVPLPVVIGITFTFHISSDNSLSHTHRCCLSVLGYTNIHPSKPCLI